MSLLVLNEFFGKSSVLRGLLADSFQKFVELTIIGSPNIQSDTKRSHSHPNKFRKSNSSHLQIAILPGPKEKAEELRNTSIVL